MFKNPLKYQQGGFAPSQDEQKVLAAFIQWLPKRVKSFQGMKPEQIAQALDSMSKTPEGKKQLQQLMNQFQQEIQEGSQSFKQGGKIHDFICKHARGGKVDCGCKQEGGNISKNQRSLSSGRFDIPFGAYMKTYFNKRSTPDVGVATRRSFGYSTSDGNEYYLEDANIGRNSVDTWVNVTPKKDTIIMQKLPSDHINDLEDYQMEAIMQRMRPDIKRVNNQENGGKVEKAETGMSKLEALKKAKETHGYNNSQARFAYANAKNALRNQGLRGRELRQSAREMISRGTREPIVAIDPTSPIQGVAIATLPNGSPLPAQTIVGSREPRMGNNYDNLTFSNAFLAARNKAGGDNGVFDWRGNNYTTKLGTNKKDNSKNNEYSMPGLEPIVIEDPDMVIPEYESLPVEQMSVPMASEIMYPGLTYMGNPTTINSSWPTSSWLSNQSNFKDTLFGPLQYRVLDRQPRVLTVANPALYNLPSISFKQGGKVEKNQNGSSSLGDFYRNKWKNDFFD